MSEPEATRRLLEQLTDRFINDPEFREQMRQDPEGTAERPGDYDAARVWLARDAHPFEECQLLVALAFKVASSATS